MKVRISFDAEIKPDFLEELKTIVDHHIEYLIDFEEFPEILFVSGATLKEQ